jgi:hypothetical protein
MCAGPSRSNKILVSRSRGSPRDPSTNSASLSWSTRFRRLSLMMTSRRTPWDLSSTDICNSSSEDDSRNLARRLDEADKFACASFLLVLRFPLRLGCLFRVHPPSPLFLETSILLLLDGPAHIYSIVFPAVDCWGSSQLPAIGCTERSVKRSVRKILEDFVIYLDVLRVFLHVFFEFCERLGSAIKSVSTEGAWKLIQFAISNRPQLNRSVWQSTDRRIVNLHRVMTGRGSQLQWLLPLYDNVDSGQENCDLGEASNVLELL